MKLFTDYGLRHTCIKYDWFTAGSNEQYSKLFELNNDGASLHELALIIWLCTPNTEVQSIEYVLFKEHKEETLFKCVEYIGLRSNTFGYTDEETARKDLQKEYPNLSDEDTETVIARWNTGKWEN